MPGLASGRYEVRKRINSALVDCLVPSLATLKEGTSVSKESLRSTPSTLDVVIAVNPGEEILL